MNRLLPLLLTTLLLALAPSAQAWQNSVTMTLAPPTEKLQAGTTVVLPGSIEYRDLAIAQASLGGIQVRYDVVDAPPWATVVVSPASDVIDTRGVQPGLTFLKERTFSVVVTAQPKYAVEETGVIEVAVLAVPDYPGGMPRTASASIPIHYVPSEHADDCPEHAAIKEYKVQVDYTGPTQEAQQAPEPVRVQSSSTTLGTTSLAVVGGMAVAGGAAGYAMHRRRLR